MLKAMNLLLEWMLFKTASSIFLTEQKTVSLTHGLECLNHLVGFNLTIANNELNVCIGRKYFQNINGYSLDEYVANRKIDNFDYHYDVPAYDDVVSEESQLNSESESQYNFNDIFPEFDKFMSFLK